MIKEIESLYTETLVFMYVDSAGKSVTVSRKFNDGAHVGQVAILLRDLMAGAGFGVDDVVIDTGYGEISANASYGE